MHAWLEPTMVKVITIEELEEEDAEGVQEACVVFFLKVEPAMHDSCAQSVELSGPNVAPPPSRRTSWRCKFDTCQRAENWEEIKGLTKWDKWVSAKLRGFL